MADVDTRIETIEDEINVLKGEIRRTLVDLRALLMREDSPLNEGALGRTVLPEIPEVPAEPAITRKEVSELLRQESAEASRLAAPDTQPQSPSTGSNPGQQVPPGAGMMGPLPAFAGMPVVQGPMWGAGAMPGPPPAPAPGPLPPDPAMAERERRLVEQERRMEEQERRLLDQERKIASAARREDVRERDVEVARVVAEQVPSSPAPVTSHDAVESRPAKKERNIALEEGEASYDRWEERNEAEVEAVVTRRRPNPGPGVWVADTEQEDRYRERDEDPLAGPPEDAYRGNNSEVDEEPSRSLTDNGRSSRVYAEYLDLLSDTERLDTADEENTAELPLDINLLSSLTRWTSLTRSRVGEQQLSNILNLYSESGHLSARLRELLEQVSGVVDGVGPEMDQDAQGCVDLIFHLHGILAGGLNISQIPTAKVAN